jgi:predicted transcriptional regulator
VSNELLGDLEKALIIGDTTLDELIDDIQDIAAEITHLTANRGLAGATIDFEIRYTTEWGDPYTQ